MQISRADRLWIMIWVNVWKLKGSEKWISCIYTPLFLAKKKKNPKKANGGDSSGNYRPIMNSICFHGSFNTWKNKLDINVESQEANTAWLNWCNSSKERTGSNRERLPLFQNHYWFLPTMGKSSLYHSMAWLNCWT